MAGCLLRKREREQGWQGKPSECLNASFSRSHGGGMTDDRRLVRAGEVPLTVKEGEEMVPLLGCEMGLLRAGCSPSHREHLGSVNGPRLVLP